MKVQEHKPYSLAGMADVQSPDTQESPGARFLERVASAVDELVSDNPESSLDDLRDDLHELCDGSVPIYTHERWQVFVDLCAYQEGLSDLGGATDDMTQNAAMALYIIAERLAVALLEEAAEQDDDDDDDAEAESR